MAKGGHQADVKHVERILAWRLDAFAQQLVTTNPDLDTLEIDKEEHDFEE